MCTLVFVSWSCFVSVCLILEECIHWEPPFPSSYSHRNARFLNLLSTPDCKPWFDVAAWLNWENMLFRLICCVVSFSWTLYFEFPCGCFRVQCMCLSRETNYVKTLNIMYGCDLLVLLNSWHQSLFVNIFQVISGGNLAHCTDHCPIDRGDVLGVCVLSCSKLQHL